MLANVPEVRLGIIAVSRDCFPISLSKARREAVVRSYGKGLYVKKAGCNALVVFLGNFGPETPETLIAQKFEGPVMYTSAAEGDGDLINGRGDATHTAVCSTAHTTWE